MTMQSASTIREEMRVLNDTANDVVPVDTNSWLSSEFWTMAGAAIANLATVAVLLGWVNQADAQTVVKAVTAVLGAAQVIIVNSILVWKFISERIQLKARIIEKRMDYVTLVAAEKVRAEGLVAAERLRLEVKA
jgi:anti-sigma-K factor RskA